MVTRPPFVGEITRARVGWWVSLNNGYQERGVRIFGAVFPWWRPTYGAAVRKVHAEGGTVTGKAPRYGR